ncbi:VUT family protein [Agrobacterium salinitolerans]|uniref:VUT family protein n=1 Tax=Agrobacterium salinitolerans TaxID=1183413 RepID=UPI001C22B023|nr:VUT family protein [Agrobacterium salinitolerans]QXC49553.1 VUT family protein [Agrobacterium salinitolerans]
MRKLFPLVAAFAATVPAANWMIGNVGTVCLPGGPCLLPVGFGLAAPSGVLLVGLALVLRDLVHEEGGAKAAITAIFVGGILSALFAPAALVAASVLAFVLAELADMFVYTPLREKRLGLAVFASGAVGAIVDSAVFLTLAFGSLEYVEGQVLGKLWMSLLAFAFIAGRRRWVEP